MYILVEFTDDNEIAVIPNNWLDGVSCAVWPNFRVGSKIRKAVMEKMHPADSWHSYPIRELYRNESYDKVSQKMGRAEKESDLQTEEPDSDSEETFRRSKRKRRTVCFSSDEDDYYTLKTRPSQSQPSSISSAHKSLPRPPAPQTLSGPLQSLPPPVPLAPLVSAPSNSRLPTPPLAPAPPSPIVPSSMLRSPSSTSNQQFSHVREIRLFTSLEKIREELRQQRAMLQSILHLLQDMPSKTVDITLPDSVSFPLTAVEEIQNLEIQLMDNSISNIVVSCLAGFGGKDMQDTIRRILKHVLSSRLAEKYNWYGKKGKLPFGQLRLATVLFKAVRRTVKSVTEQEVEVVTREWLRTASDRDGGRKCRIRPSSPGPESSL